jgi:hypothetical protein
MRATDAVIRVSADCPAVATVHNINLVRLLKTEWAQPNIGRVLAAVASMMWDACPTRNVPCPFTPAKRPRGQQPELIAMRGSGDFPADDGKDKAAQSLGQRGGKARAKALSAQRRKQIAQKAAAARWKV